MFLTDSGCQLAEQSRERHQIVEEFLRALGVSLDAARLNAEGIEHLVSEETLRAFQRFISSKRA